jgi:DNA (cytosine-5)-methyltransferase 1
MADVAAARGTAGLSVVSTFSGCGGSCLGFEMAGYRVLWSNEFVEAARDTYAANHPDTPLDGRDIRQVKPEEILEAIGLERGELDVLQGSPPCASFSSAGKRSEHWGEVRTYSDTKQRTDDLFFEFVRILNGLQPRAFVAENVAGLTRGVAVGYFKEIMRAMSGAGYVVRCKILDAQWLGVPQTRSRAIIVGVRNDLGLEPDFPTPLPYRYSLREVLPELAEKSRVLCTNTGSHFTSVDVTDRPAAAILASEPPKHKAIERGPQYLSEGGTAVLDAWKVLRPGEHSAKYQSLVRADPEAPSPAILQRHGGASSIACVTVPNEPRRFTIPELRIVCGFPSDFVLTGTYGQQWERLGRAVPPPMMRAIAASLRDGLFAKLGRTAAGFTEAR